MWVIFGAVCLLSKLQMTNSMKQSIIKYCWICIFLCVPFLISAQTQFADSLFAVGNLEYAQLEYERLLFLKEGNKDDIIYKKALCEKAAGQFSKAVATLERANLFQQEDSVAFAMRYELAINAFLSGDYPKSLNQLVQMEYFINNKDIANQSLYLHILTLNEMRKWEEAKIKFSKYIAINQLDSTSIELYSFLEKPKIKNIKKARNLSYLLPGVGQMYAGYFSKGLFSSLMQASLMAFGAYSLYTGYFFTGAFTGIGLFYAFYSGGARHAEYLAKQKNKELTKSYNDPIRELILKTEGKN